MAFVYEIIKDAYREANLIPITQSPTLDEQTEGLSQLQTVVSSVLGNEAGEPLLPANLTGSPPCPVPDNTRLMAGLTYPASVKLNSDPDDGARLAVIDVANNFATYPLTIDGNGRNIEGFTALSLVTSGTSREWFYRADLGNWVRVTSLGLNDQLPFPGEFDTFFSLILAMRLNPRNGQELSPESSDALKRGRSQIRSRYRQTKKVCSEIGLLRLRGNLRWYTPDFDTGNFK